MSERTDKIPCRNISRWLLNEASLFVRAIRTVGFLLTFVSILVTIHYGVAETTNSARDGFVAGFFLSIGAYAVSFGLQGVAWHLLVGSLSQISTTGWRDLEIYAYSNLMRRTPGMIWYLVERVENYRLGGIAAHTVLIASATEWILLIVAGGIVYVLTYSNQHIDVLLLIEGAGLVTLIWLGIVVLRRIARPPSKCTSEPAWLKRLVMSLPELGIVCLVYSVCYVFGGIIVFILTHLVDPTSPLLLRQAINLWAVTGGAGLLISVIVPLNLGLREFTLVVMLLPFTTTAGAITIAAMVRLVFTVADITFSIALWRLSRSTRFRKLIVHKSHLNTSEWQVFKHD